MPLTVNALADLVSGLKDIISEPSRTLVCRRVVTLIAKALKDTDPINFEHWITKGRFQFARNCELTADERWVPEDLHIEKTALATFCDKWLSVEAFRLRNNPDANLRPITPEQNALRVTMIEELREIARKETSK
jgi:hypothetical protein